jgi:hypothetical protein
MAAKPRDYEQYLLSSHWRRFRHLVLVRALLSGPDGDLVLGAIRTMARREGSLRDTVSFLIHNDVPLEAFAIPCTDCKGPFRPSELNLHHLNYDCLGRETLTVVVVLCQGCHQKRHGIKE